MSGEFLRPPSTNAHKKLHSLWKRQLLLLTFLLSLKSHAAVRFKVILGKEGCWGFIRKNVSVEFLRMVDLGAGITLLSVFTKQDVSNIKEELIRKKTLCSKGENLKKSSLRQTTFRGILGKHKQQNCDPSNDSKPTETFLSDSVSRCLVLGDN